MPFGVQGGDRVGEVERWMRLEGGWWRNVTTCKDRASPLSFFFNRSPRRSCPQIYIHRAGYRFSRWFDAELEHLAAQFLDFD